MEPEQVKAFFQAVEGLNKEEWEQLRDVTDQEFAAESNRVQLSRANIGTATKLIAMKNEWPYDVPTPTQTKMGF